MLRTIENQSDEIFNPREGPHSSTAKSSNENTPNIPKKTPTYVEQISLPKIPSKSDTNQFCKNISYDKPFNSKSTSKSKYLGPIGSYPNSNNEQNKQKNFIEKKRKRKNKWSDSNSRSKKSKKKQINHQIIYSRNNIISSFDLLCKEIDKKEQVIHDLEEDSKKSDEKIIEIKDDTRNGHVQSHKKRNRVDEKELIAKAEKQFKERINKEYSDEEYNKDLDNDLKEKRAQFMKENFPIMYTKEKYYLYTVLLKKRRMQPVNFIQPKDFNQMIQENQKSQTLYLNEELEPPENIPSENSDDDKIQKTKNKSAPTSKVYRSNQKNQCKNKSKKAFSEINSSLSKINININNNFINQEKKEKEQMKNNLTDPKQTIQENNKIFGAGLSDTSPSEHDMKNSDLNHLIEEIEVQNTMNNKRIKFKTSYTLLPKQVWSFPKDNSELDVEMFYDDCIEIWPFKECIFVKEIALEFLMKNNYSTSVCLKQIKNFVSFMKKRAEELNISILNKNEKTVKKYSLRKSKNN